MLTALFVLWSALGIWSNVHRWGPVSAFGEVTHWDTSEFGVHGGGGTGVSLDWVGFALLAALGLWRYWRAGRMLALFLTWCWWIGSVLLIAQVFHVKFALRSGTPILPNVPEAFLRIAVIPFFLIQLWQYVILKRRDIEALFYPPVRLRLPRTPPAAGEAPPADAAPGSRSDHTR